MANSGGTGTKFVSVNLNKSYGSVSNHHQPYGSHSYGQSGTTRVRPGSHGVGGGGAGAGGMVVLSRPRSSQKAGAKLSVPPPLNLPSLRKEHERFDSSGPGSGLVGGRPASGGGTKPTLSGPGWTKPGILALQEKDGNVALVDSIDQNMDGVDTATRGNIGYMPPSARLAKLELAGSVSAPLVEKTAVLRGEDFPSLRAALPSNASGPVQKQKDSTHQKYKQVLSEEPSNEQTETDNSPLSSLVHRQPNEKSLGRTIGNGSTENDAESCGLGRPQVVKQAQKQDFFPSPLPLVRLNPRSDWADDERDTGQKFAERGRVYGYSESEAYWDKEFDMPRNIALPHKLPHSLCESRGKSKDETGKVSSSEVPKVEPYRRDLGPPSMEGSERNLWRTSPLENDAFNAQKVVNDKNGVGARSMNLNREVAKENKYVLPRAGDNHHHVITGNKESAFGRRDMGHGQEGRYQWNHIVESSVSRQSERDMRDRYGSEQSNKYRGDVLQNKSSFSSSGKGLSVNDPILNFGRDKRGFSKSERPYLDDPFLKEVATTSFDEGDPFSSGLVGVIKRKKDAVKQADFYDPVRESFEAELERVQKMQEQERQRIVEEQERALEQARREEEERQRLIREEEEQRRRLEEEARDAAWKAEQERLEAIRQAEEQRIAKEEERRQILLEEERRKQAAKQKLLELEARIAKRQAEAANGDSCAATADEKAAAVVIEKDVPRVSEIDNWEDSDRILERINTSGSSDSGLNQSFQLGPRPQSYKEGSSGFLDRQKPADSWRRDAYEDGNNSPFHIKDQDLSQPSLMRDLTVGGRAFPRKEVYGGSGYMLSRTNHRGGMQQPNVEDFSHLKGHRWTVSGDGDPYNRNIVMDNEFHENPVEKYGDVGWGQGQSRGSSRSPYADRINSEADEHYSYGRSRYSMRQPRVLPPPPLVSMHKSSFRGENEHPKLLHNHASRSESTMQTVYYDGQQLNFEASEKVDVQPQSTMTEEQKLDEDTTSRCDSQSSLSVSSPPHSPTHLSLDDFEESRNSPVVSAATEENDISVSGNDEKIDLTKDFEGLHLQEEDSSHMMDNLVLGFNEGVEIRIASDEVENSSRKEEGQFGISEGFVGLMEEQKPFDGLQSDANCLQPLDNSPRKCTDGSSWRIQEAENRTPDSITEPANTAPDTLPASDPLICVNGSSSSGECARHVVPSLVNMASHCSAAQAVTSTLPVGSSQADLPIKLQFGLFSGPSLIPSPVPSIQIGSIQMPLHLHSPVGPSVTHIHSSHPPLFQFGQLRYTSPMSQGILPMAPQSVSFVQPNVQAHYNLNQSSSGPLPVQHSNISSTHNLINDVAPYDSAGREITESNVLIHKCLGETKIMSAQGSEARDAERHDTVVQDYRPSFDGTGSGQLQNGQTASQLVSSDKNSNGSKDQGASLGTKERKFAYSSGNSRSRSSILSSQAFRSDSSRVKGRPQQAVRRTEFRVRESVDKRQSSSLASSNNLVQDDKSNFTWWDVGPSARNRSKKGLAGNKPLKQIVEPETSSSGPSSSQGTFTGTRHDRKIEKEAAVKTQNISPSGEGNLKRTICSEEDVDTPLQSGIVRVFTQPGIEVPSDEDDFIQVRSKRQMLNHRREQREKEIKAKSRVTKATRKSRFTTRNAVVSASSNKISAPMGGAPNSFLPDIVVSEGQVNMEVSTGVVTVVSQPLAPIGTPVNFDVQADKMSHKIKSHQTGPTPFLSNGGKDIGPGLLLEAENNILDNVKKSLDSWAEQNSQQVMDLTQTQLDEAMNPGRFDKHVASIGYLTSSVTESITPSSSILTKDKSVSSPINSLLAGEKIQFGAVTSPTLLPTKSHAVSNTIGAPGSCRPDIKISRNLPANENDCTFFFEKDKHQNECSVHLVDSEAEAEAAASAVAVAAISSDEIVGNSLGTRSVSVSGSDAKSFGCADIDGSTEGDQQLASQSRAEESLSVALPADLSVESPPIFWQPLPSPQNSSTQMLSHFPVGPPSRFPFYEMNPMLGGPIFAFGPHDDSAKTQLRPHKGTASGSGPLGTWQQCHSGMDSFYGPPTGFTGPYISPPGGIPAVQGPPHMVVYNHFPVGQFGQVGLSFMGTTYIPSGKQPDWKHNPSSSAVGIGEVDMNNINLVSAQRNPPNLTAPVQHLAPGSQLLPMASPLPMMDMPPFQSSDVSVQGRWSHVPATPLHSVPLPMPLQQHEAGKPPSKFSHGQPIDQSITASRCAESRSSTPSDSNRSFPVAADVGPCHFADELGLVDSSNLPGASGAPTSSSGGAIAAVDKSDGAQNGQSTNALKSQCSQQKSLAAHKPNHSTGYNYQRGGTSQKNSSGADWSHHHRRMGYHGRTHFVGTEKGHPPPKLKQIYVAKQTSAGTSTAS